MAAMAEGGTATEAETGTGAETGDGGPGAGAVDVGTGAGARAGAAAGGTSRGAGTVQEGRRSPVAGTDQEAGTGPGPSPLLPRGPAGEQPGRIQVSLLKIIFYKYSSFVI